MPRDTPYPRHPNKEDVPRIPESDVTLLWYGTYYDSPLDGAAEWNGKRYWYRAIFEYRSDDYEGVYELIDLPDSEWAIIDRHQRILRKYVGKGHVFDYSTGKLLPGKVDPDWEGYLNHPEAQRDFFVPQGRIVATFRLWGKDPEPKPRRRRKKTA